jgi:hypothetical protein
LKKPIYRTPNLRIVLKTLKLLFLFQKITTCKKEDILTAHGVLNGEKRQEE